MQGCAPAPSNPPAYSTCTPFLHGHASTSNANSLMMSLQGGCSIPPTCTPHILVDTSIINASDMSW